MKKYPRRSISKHQRLTLREEILSKATSVKEPFLLMFQARPEPLEKSWFHQPGKGCEAYVIEKLVSMMPHFWGVWQLKKEEFGNKKTDIEVI